MERPALDFKFFAFYASKAWNRVVLTAHRSGKYVLQISDRARRTPLQACASLRFYHLPAAAALPFFKRNAPFEVVLSIC